MKELDKSYFFNKEVVDLFVEKKIILNNVEDISGDACSEKSFKVDTNQGRYFIKFSMFNRFSKQFLSALAVENSKIGNIIQLPIMSYNLKKCNRQINIYDWIDGSNLKDVLKTSLGNEYSYYGSRCGDLMRKIHFSLKKTDGIQYDILLKLAEYYKRIEMSGFRFEYEFNYRKYLEKNLDILISDINPSFVHSDFKPKNLMIDKRGIYVVDIDSSMIGNPWLDFYDKAFPLYPSKELFNAALIKSYFEDNVPEFFWKYFQILSVFALIQNTAWLLQSKDYGYMRSLENYLWDTYDGFNEIIPKWYYC